MQTALFNSITKKRFLFQNQLFLTNPLGMECILRIWNEILKIYISSKMNFELKVVSRKRCHDLPISKIDFQYGHHKLNVFGLRGENLDLILKVNVPIINFATIFFPYSIFVDFIILISRCGLVFS